MVLEEATTYRVVHPLDDVAEQKVDSTHLGRMRLTPAVRYSLLALRAYMVLMMAMVFYYVVRLAV